MCSACRGLHDEACTSGLVHSKMADEFAAAAVEPCDYERYGCDAGALAYHLAAEHRRACPHAPCGCPERFPGGIGGCDFFGSRQKLLDHVSGPDHSRPIIDIRYGHEWKLSLPLSRRWYLLLGEESQPAAGADRYRNVFLVAIGDRGDTTAVSVLCVRADGGAQGAAQFSCRLAVEHPADGTRVILESPLMSSSSLSGGAPAPGEVRSLPVPNEYLSGDSIPLSIHIHRLEPPAPGPPLSPPTPAAATPTCPATAAPPPCPAAATVTVAFQPTATSDQSNKKRKATNPRKYSTPNRS